MLESSALVEARGIFDEQQDGNPGEAERTLHPVEVVRIGDEVVHNVLQAVHMWNAVAHYILHLHSQETLLRICVVVP